MLVLNINFNFIYTELVIQKLRANRALKSLELAATKSEVQDQSQKSEMESDPVARRKNEDSGRIPERSKFNLLISTIIVSITFPAIYNPPGGLSSTDSNGEKIVKAALSGNDYFMGFIKANSVAFGIAFASILPHFLSSIVAAWKNPYANAVISAAFFLNYLSIVFVASAYLLGLRALLPQSLSDAATVAAASGFICSGTLSLPVYFFFFFRGKAHHSFF